jgi:hypothetical protein
MPTQTHDVPWSDGITYRVESATPNEAVEKRMEGYGTPLPPVVPRPGPGENPVFAPPQPPPATGGTVYIPPGPPARTETPLLDPVFNWIGETVAPAALDVAKPAILPTTIGAALNYGGPYVPGVGRALSVLPAQARESIGSVIGTGANMLLGIEEPSIKQLALSAVSPGATRKGAQVGTKLLPGAQAARATGLVEEAQALPGRISQGLTLDVTGQFFDQARKLNPIISLDATDQAVRQLVQTEKQMAEAGVEFPDTVLKVARNLQRTLAQSQPQGGTELAKLDAWRQRIGAMIDLSKNTEEQRALRHLYGSIMTDLETAAPQVGGEGAKQLLEGIKQSRRVFSAADFGDMITNATSKERPGDLLQQIDFGKIKKELAHPRTEQQAQLAAFLEENPSEKADLIALVDDMNRRNVKLMPPVGVMGGSLIAGARGSAGYLAGQGINTLVGSEVVNPMTTGALTVAGSQAMSRALLTPGGRAFIKQMLAESGTLNIAQLLTQFGGQTARANLGPPAVDLAQRVSTRATGFPGYPAPEERR